MKIVAHWRRLAHVTAMTLALAVAASLPAAAQSTDQPPVSPESLSQTQLEAFVAAATRVSEISDELQAQAQDVNDEAELARLQEAANQQMVAAVQDEGLTVEEYNMIFQMAQVDPQLNDTLREMLTE